MELEKNWRKMPKTGESRRENLATQPLKSHKIFNNAQVLTEGWYPVVASKRIKQKQSHSFKIGAQRIVVFRGEDNKVRTMDAFCPHMGADLSRGSVEGNSLRCYFHRWKFGPDGRLLDIPCKKNKPFELKTTTYPTEEHYGFIWVFSAPEASHPFPIPVGLQASEVQGAYLMKHKLFAHHHILMASAIDLQHFASVHDLHADFDLEINETSASHFHWNVRGHLSRQKNWRMNFARWMIGNTFQYDAVFAGGTAICMTYGRHQRWGGKIAGRKLPSFYVMWGATPLKNGLSEVSIFILQKKSKGFFGFLKNKIQYMATIALLFFLKDDDVQAFPNMRFQAQNLIDQDRSVAHLIKLTENLKRSAWSFEN